MGHKVRFLALNCAILAAFAFTPAACARVSQASGESWPAIKPAELAIKDNPARPGSAAMIL